MTFWDFLNWLFSVIDKVRTWFGTAFWTLYNGALNAWNWAVQKGAEAFNSAKSWVLEKSYAVTTWVDNKVSAIWANISQAWTAISGAITTAYNNAVAWATPKIQAARDFAQGLFDGVKSWAQSTIQGVIVGLTNLLAIAKTELHTLFDPLLPLKSIVNILTDLGSTNNYNRLKTFLQDMFSTLNTLVTNPLGFLTGMLFPIFTEIICYALGYGLGALENQLPPLPSWGSGGGTVLPPGGELPPGTGELVHPIDPIYVSGYSFTPPTHPGVDLGLTLGQAVHAMHNGLVVESGWSNVGYGNTVVIENDTWRTRYGHLQVCLVQPGQVVSANQLIGNGDTTGNSTGNHLHLEVKLHGSFVDPLLYL